MSTTFALTCVAILLANGGFALGAGRRPAMGTTVYVIALIVSLALFAGALWRLVAAGPADGVNLPLGLPWIGAHFRIDALSAFFLVIVNLGSAGASLFAIGYGRHEEAPGRVLPFYPVFLAAMNLVVMADDAFAFLFSWEFMSLASWALVMAHHEDEENRHAGFVYIVMASAGTLALLLAFGLLAGSVGGYAFDAMRATPLAPAGAALVFCLALFGAGSKAGLVPLHVWLPLAHPAAPSHVSALMSGVMTKVAIYGFIRIAFDLLGPPQWWWAVLVLIVGGATAVLGLLYALLQDDLKRLLAYSTVENVGIVFIGLGLALAFGTNAMPAAAALALTAALFHALNHSLFKSLLFFGAGAVLNATGERNIERMGGLIHRMPVTAFAFLVGAAAISALPPLNGFVSEWLTFQAILISPDMAQWSLKIIVPAIGGLLALAAALAAACFVRAYGVAFLGRPRSPAAANASEVDRFSLAAMLAFAGLCLLLGILPGLVIDALAPVTALVVGGQLPAQVGQQWLSIVPIAEGRSSYDGLLVLVFIAVSAGAAAFAIHRFASRVGAPRTGLGWRVPGCHSDHAIQRGEFRSADPSGVRHQRLPRPRACHDAAAGKRHAGAFPRRGPRSRLGGALCADRRPRRRRRRPAEPLPVPDHPALSQPRFRGAGRAAVAGGAMALIRDLAVQAAQMLLVLALAPLLTGFIRKLKARLVRRQGPPLIQPYRDLAKLLRKDVVLAANASWLFRAAPYLIFAATWVAAALVPTFASGLVFSWSADLIAIIALLGSARFFQALAGMDVGTAFGGIGASREVMIASLAEPAMLLIVFSLALVAGSTQLSTVASELAGGVGLRVSLGLALVALIMVAIAENGRVPVDNPATHLELTMIHEAMILEYSGRHLAVIELAASLKLLLYLSLIACVFVPWGIAPADAGLGAFATGLAFYIAKIAIGGMLLALFETSIAKMRVFRVPDFMGAGLMLGLLATLLLFVTRTLR